MTKFKLYQRVRRNYLKEFILLNLTIKICLKSYDRLADRISLQEGNLHTIQIMSKDEMFSFKEKFQTLELHVQNEDQRLGASMKSLEIYTGQEIKALQKTVEKDWKHLRKFLELMNRERRHKDRI